VTGIGKLDSILPGSNANFCPNHAIIANQGPLTFIALSVRSERGNSGEAETDDSLGVRRIWPRSG
jgi:hypothetical protein